MKRTIKVLSAGSLRHAFPKIIEAFTPEMDVEVSLSLGPAGLLRERIENGEDFDLFASANMEHPQALAAAGIAEEAICFARNRLCMIARSDIGMTTENFVEILANPDLRIATSTPGDDPSGDYAFELFNRIEAFYPGMGMMLKARARQLVGGRNSPPTPPGKGPGYLIADGEVDLMTSYYSNARLLEGNPAFSVVEIPVELAPAISYGLSLRKGVSREAHSLREFMLGDAGRVILSETGFALPLH